MPSGLFGGGGQTQPATYSQGGNPATYVPTAQPAADLSYQNLLSSLYNPSLSATQGISQLPASQYYPAAQGYAPQYTAWGQQMGAANPYANQYLAGTAAQSALQGNVGQGQLALGNQLAGAVPGLLAGGQQVYNTAFDPQQELYNSLVQQQTDQSNASAAQSGLAGTPYAAGLQNEALGNLAINWQNQQLGRQTQGLQGLQSADTSAFGLGNAASQLQNYGLNTIGQAGAAPYNAYNTQAQNAITGLNSGLSGLGNIVNLGNQQFQIPQQVLNDLQSYLQLGQASSSIAGQLGQQGFNQNQTGFSNAATLAGLGGNALLGSQGISGALGLGSGGLIGAGGLGGLFGGGAGAGTAAGFAAGDAATGLSASDLLALPFFGL